MKKSEDGVDEFSSPSDSKSCSSSLTSKGCSSEESQPNWFSILALAAHLDDMNFKRTISLLNEHNQSKESTEFYSAESSSPSVIYLYLHERVALTVWAGRRVP